MHLSSINYKIGQVPWVVINIYVWREKQAKLRDFQYSTNACRDDTRQMLKKNSAMPNFHSKI
jgi:hypothetical protein